MNSSLLTPTASHERLQQALERWSRTSSRRPRSAPNLAAGSVRPNAGHYDAALTVPHELSAEALPLLHERLGGLRALCGLRATNSDLERAVEVLVRTPGRVEDCEQLLAALDRAFWTLTGDLGDA